MLLKEIVQGIKLVKGYDISILDFKTRSNFICDYFVICNGNSCNQVFSIFQHIEKFIMKKLNIKPYHIEGLKNKKWILIDYESIVVHIFQKEVRLYYNIENVWNHNNL
ncbi:ribosome silencing factor [Blattabacterium cuenoti]|uniref:ribosome silencing factor n=1 Tax=Blattabacterium cuenoti TaxID=1653831 RepID=UPI00163D0F4F|nr:ribosome silencing factor [Blattabacterium cuenoti]